MIYTFIAEHCSDLPVSTCCRVMGVSTSGFYQRRNEPVTNAELAEAYAANEVHDIWTMSRRAYGSPRVRKELRLGRCIRRSKTTCERLMRICGAQGIHYPPRHKRRRHASAETDPNPDLVRRAFDPEGPDRLWVMDITEHPTTDGKVYLAVVVDAWARRVVGWSIAGHLRAELVADAIQMATWRRRPPRDQVIAHSDHGAQGELNWSSQHLDDGGVVDGDDEGASAGGAVVSGADPVAWGAYGRVAGGSCPVLGSDRPRCEDRRRCGRGGRVIPRGVSVVPTRWGREPMPSADCVGPLPVILRT